MRGFVNKVKSEAFKRGGKIWQFFAGCINRAENFLKSDWTTLINNVQRLDNATSVDVNYIVYPFPDITDKMNRYRLKENEIISELNYLLSSEGVKDWTFFKAREGVFGRFTIHLAAIRPKAGFTFRTSLWEAVQIAGQLFLLKGFFFIGVVIRENGVWIYHAIHDNPTSTEIFGLQNLMTFYEREQVIDDVVENTIKNIAKSEQKGGIVGKVETWAKIILVILVVLAVTYIVSEWRKTGEFFKKGLDVIGKKG
jgi:hypothetical protein